MVSSVAALSFNDHVKAIDAFPLNKRITCAVFMILADLLAFSGVLVVAHLLGAQINHAGQFNVFFALACMMLFAYALLGHYFKRLPYWAEYKQRVILVLVAIIAQGAFASYQLQPITPWVFAWLAGLGFYILLSALFRSGLRKANVWKIPTVIVGSGPNAVACAKNLLRENYLGYDLLCFLSVDNALKDAIQINGVDVPVKNMTSKVDVFLRRLGCPCLIMATENNCLGKLDTYADKIGLNYPSLLVSQHLKAILNAPNQSRHLLIHEILLLEIQSKINQLASRFAKRTFDCIAAATLLILLAPVLVVIALLIKKSGPGVIFSHTRIGRGGKPFGCLKFRTMVPNAKSVLEHLLATDENARKEWYEDFKLKNDPRITAVGKFLRATSLDELPQLWNVLCGDMSLVGPRPVIKDEIERYGVQAAFYYKAKPGITGLWQVSGRNDITYDSRIDLDVWYVENWSLWKDIIILIRTVKVVFSRDGAY